MLHITTQNIGEAAVLRCAGRIVAETVSILRQAAHAQSSCDLVILDLAAVTGMDAAGLGLFVSLHIWLRKKGANLKLLNVPSPIEKLLHLSGIDAVLETCSVRQMIELLCQAHAAANAAAVEAEAMSA